MYHKILVPLDGSKRAEKILPHVEELAKTVPGKSHIFAGGRIQDGPHNRRRIY